MVRSALAQSEFAAHPVADEEQALAAATAEAIQALRSRLATAQKRAAEADLRRQALFADHARTMQSHHDDIQRLEDTVADLSARVHDYNLALNEAATLIADMNSTIGSFQRQLAQIQGLTAAACLNHPNPNHSDDVSEDEMAAALDRLRGSDARQDLRRIKQRLDRISLGTTQDPR